MFFKPCHFHFQKKVFERYLFFLDNFRLSDHGNLARFYLPKREKKIMLLK